LAFVNEFLIPYLNDTVFFHFVIFSNRLPHRPAEPDGLEETPRQAGAPDG
jgi:hypothetical protein